MTHKGHVIHPHDHDWQIRVWGFIYKPCTGFFYCQTCRDWFEGEKCAVAGRARPEPAVYVGRVLVS